MAFWIVLFLFFFLKRTLKMARNRYLTNTDAIIDDSTRKSQCQGRFSHFQLKFLSRPLYADFSRFSTQSSFFFGGFCANECDIWFPLLDFLILHKANSALPPHWQGKRAVCSVWFIILPDYSAMWSQFHPRYRFSRPGCEAAPPAAHPLPSACRRRCRHICDPGRT